MRLLVFDVSGSTGFAEFDSQAPSTPLDCGVIKLDRPARDYAPHPWGYVLAATDLACKMVVKVREAKPAVVAVEETNGARARFTQKFLEYCHLALLLALAHDPDPAVRACRVVYVNTSDWRQKMDVRLTADDKRQNARLARNKRRATERGLKLDKKNLGIRGRVTIKHVAVRRANQLFGLSLIAKDDDVADALLIGAAVLSGVQLCRGAE